MPSVSARQRLEIYKMDSPRSAPTALEKESELASARGSVSPEWPYWSSGLVPTTLVLGGLPLGFSTADLVQQLDDMGFRDEYNFAHAPSDLIGPDGAGYAVLNATSHTTGCSIAGRLRGFVAWKLPMSKAVPAGGCTVAWSLVGQGMEELMWLHQTQPDGSRQGPWVRLGEDWITMHVPNPYAHPSARGLASQPAVKSARRRGRRGGRRVTGR